MGLFGGIIKSIFKPVVNKFRGNRGEAKVNSKLNPLIFDKVEHRLINNLILVDANGKSHQIDHIEIRQNGIFCIETKNYAGRIIGEENQEKWMQFLGGEKNQFINPLKQNKSHIYHISQVLGKKYKINSVVVMVKNNAERINIAHVVNLRNLRSYLENYNDGTLLTIEEMDIIYNKLLNAGTKMSNREHVKNIKKTQKEIKKGICPRCGGQLVEREGQYGKFIGCSNYPNCKFILKRK